MTVHLFGSFFLSKKNSRIFQGGEELQLTLTDHVFKMKSALHSELSRQPSQNNRNQIRDFLPTKQYAHQLKTVFELSIGKAYLLTF